MLTFFFTRFCGPGTRLTDRLEKGDVGVNILDEACKQHDIAYHTSSELSTRHEADKVLADKAWERFRSKDASLGEKVAALGVTGVMKLKRKLGMGLKKRPTKRRRSTKPRSVVKKAKRIIPSPKFGGFLPLLLPILGAIGALGGGAAGIAKAVNDAKKNVEELKENQRHNQMMESIAMGKGLHLKPYRKGSGLYLKPYKKGSGIVKGSSQKN